MSFQKINNIAGWFIFAISLVTYWSTMEETASYWDCGEFISVSYKLEVPHPPGAPLFLLIGRLFSFLAFGDVSQVAYWINFSSVLAGAFSILFLFWTITLLGRKLMKINHSEELENGKGWVLIGAGVVGALACNFSDSFWFSAVEAEVYAMSSFFTAFVIWAMLKWDLIDDESKANRWLILIFYMMGLSIGIHLLNLVTIPALSLIYYFKKFKEPTVWGVVATMIISLIIIITINEIIIPGLPTIAGSFEVGFVNSLGMPFGSGVLFFSLLLIGGVVYGIIYSQKKGLVLLNTSLISFAFILIGYASYAIVVIRSNDNPPINENDPSDVMSFVRYLKREQYGSRPLIKGHFFTARIVDIEDGDPIYAKGKDKYEIIDHKSEYVYDPNSTQILFPRIWSSEPSHQKRYRQLLGLNETEEPTISDNYAFLFSHQIGWMYIRYFMFNFAGRESDIQDADWFRPTNYGEELPTELAENKARNNYYMIPLILGLIGLIYQLIYDPKNFSVVGLLFILTGVALVIYLNSPPTEPRERDYIYTGSYYAFCIWIGFAVIALADWIGKIFKNTKGSAVIATTLCLLAPVLMATQNWDDHDRSNRYYSVDSAVNYLQSCAPNAILFSGGDNDTFPLWYAQEVEGVRTDMRVVVLSYYNTDWYIGQTMRQTYESKAFPYTLSLEDYGQGGPNNYLPYYDAKIESIDLNKYLDLLKKGYKGLKHPLYGDNTNMVPAKILTLDIDVDKVRALGIVPKEMDSLIVSKMELRLTGNALEKKDLAMLDLLASNNWERPIYVNNTSKAQFKVDLEPYTIQEGNAYRILPIRNPTANGNPNLQRELVNTEASFENITKKFQYRELDNPNVYYTEDYRRSVMSERGTIVTVARAFVEEDKPEKARELLLFSLEKMPDAGIRFDRFTSLQMVELLMEVGEKERAIEITTLMVNRMDEMISYQVQQNDIGRELRVNFYVLGEFQKIMMRNGETDLATDIEKRIGLQEKSLGIQGEPGFE